MIEFSDKQIASIAGANHKWNVFIGATRSGKSYIQLHLIPRRIKELRGRPGLRLLMAKTLGSIESNILEPMRDLYGENYVGRLRVKEGLIVANVFGCRFVCIGGDNIRSVDKLRGKAVAYVAGDEAPTWPIELFTMLITRLVKEWCRADLTGNPEGPYHWFKRSFLDRSGQMDIFHKSFGLDDNPTLTEKEKEDLRNSLTGAWYRRFILGEWAAAEGAIYDMFDRDIHVVEPHEIPDFNKLVLGLDWGMNHPTAGDLIAHNGFKRAFQIAEYDYRHKEGTRKKTTSEIVEGISSWCMGIGVQQVNNYIDPSALALKTEIQAHNSKVREGEKEGTFFRIIPADNDVLPGISMISGALLRGEIKFSSVCVNSIRQHSSYVWDSKAQQRGIDQPLKVDDDHPDGFRYGWYTGIGKRREGGPIIKTGGKRIQQPKGYTR